MTEVPLCWCTAKDSVNYIDSCTLKIHAKDPEVFGCCRKQEGSWGMALHFGSLENSPPHMQTTIVQSSIAQTNTGHVLPENRKVHVPDTMAAGFLIQWLQVSNISLPKNGTTFKEIFVKKIYVFLTLSWETSKG